MVGVWQHLDAAARLLGVFLSLRPSKHFFAAKITSTSNKNCPTDGARYLLDM